MSALLTVKSKQNRVVDSMVCLALMKHRYTDTHSMSSTSSDLLYNLVLAL